MQEAQTTTATETTSAVWLELPDRVRANMRNPVPSPSPLSWITIQAYLVIANAANQSRIVERTKFGAVEKAARALALLYPWNRALGICALSIENNMRRKEHCNVQSSLPWMHPSQLNKCWFFYQSLPKPWSTCQTTYKMPSPAKNAWATNLLDIERHTTQHKNHSCLVHLRSFDSLQDY